MTENSKNPSLERALGLRDSLAIVIGSMIGTGIFLKTATMTESLGSSLWVILAWFAAGVLSFLGGITYAELGALFPEAGGGYVYIREAYGRFLAFLAGWVSFWILFPGSIAAYAVASSIFLGGVFHWSISAMTISLILIAVFAAINCLAVSFGGMIQSILTGVKVLLILSLAGAIFFFTPSPQPSLGLAEITHSGVTLGAFSLATLSALWAFDGWEAVARVAGEIRNAQKNLPLALLLGIVCVFGLYAFLNLAYFWALPLSEIATANSTAHPDALPIATKAVVGFWGTRGVQILSSIFVISTLGAMNGCILTSARVPFAMSRDGLFFKFLSVVSPRTHVPVRAIWMQALVAAILALSGTFDQLTNYVIFSAWIFYGLTGLTVFIFRRTRPDIPRVFRVPGYPWIPALFVLLALGLVVNTLIESPAESLIGIGLILTGVPVYLLFYRQRA
jgi:APA family basic amino acid/polyamine antiporter